MTATYTRTVIIEITYDRDIDFSTVEALADAMKDGEGVAVVTARLATVPVVRLNMDMDDDKDDVECNCAYKNDPYKAPETHARTCPIFKLSGFGD